MSEIIEVFYVKILRFLSVSVLVRCVLWVAVKLFHLFSLSVILLFLSATAAVILIMHQVKVSSQELYIFYNNNNKSLIITTD